MNAATKAEAKAVSETITISPPKFRVAQIEIKGTSPYMQARFSWKAGQAMMEKMAAGQQAGAKKVRKARDFDDDFLQAQHISTEGWNGMAAAAFRNASIDVCRAVGFKMTLAKMSVFVEADGLDKYDATPLVRIIGPAPEKSTLAVRNATGVLDIRVRPIWRDWGAKLRVRFDSDQFKLEDVVNLIARAGQQIGVGEGRPFSRDSAGLGFGLFDVVNVSQ